MAKTTPHETRNIDVSNVEKPPLNSDEYLSLDNQSAAKKIPKSLAAEARSQSMPLYVPDKGFDPAKAVTPRKTKREWQIELPRGAAAAPVS